MNQYEPTHGIKDQNGSWQCDIRGLVVGDHERVILATVEKMNKDSQGKYGDGSVYECVPLPVPAIWGSYPSPHEVWWGQHGDRHYLAKTARLTSLIHEKISQEHLYENRVTEVHLNSVDAEILRWGGQSADVDLGNTDGY